MTYEIETKDGIVITGIPDDIPSDHHTIKAKVTNARFARDVQENPGRSFLENAARQVGLTGRAGLRGVGLDPLANLISLPQPETATERVAQDVGGTMAGGGAMGAGARYLAQGTSGALQGILQSLAANPAAMQVAAAGGGAGAGLARESGAGPTGQTLAALAGSMAAPVGTALPRWGLKNIADTLATFGAARGYQPSIERLARRAARETAGETMPEQLAALRKGTEYAPGVKPTAAEAIAEMNMGQPQQIGGATIRLQKDLSGARGLEDVLPSAVKQQNIALAEHVKNVKAETKPLREEAITKANLKGVLVDDVNSKIEAAMAVPGLRASDIVQKTLNTVKEKIASLADAGGRVNADDLYTVRKEIGNTINRFSKETANWDKRLTGKLERQIQLYIDDAIESSGGVGWKDYLQKYSTGMKAAENQFARQREMKIIAAGVKGSAAHEMGEAGLKRPPTMLIREMMLTNWILRMLRQDPNTPVAKYVAEQMRDPEMYAKLLGSTPEKITKEAIKARANLGYTSPEFVQSTIRSAERMSDAARRAALAAALQQAQP